MSTPERREVADLLLRKARADLAAAELLADHDDQDDGVVGFHAQQACEKAFKSVLAVAGERLPRTHDLEALREQLGSAGRAVPGELEDIAQLSAWAVLMRYEDADVPLDRPAAIQLASAAIVWAAGQLAS
ncbi:MAG: HEPN domain-containing protein [Solirubrobacteraceae bacterium]